MKKIAFILLTSMSLTASAQAPEPKAAIGIDFFAQIKSLSHVGQRGNDIVFAARQANTADDRYDYGIYHLTDGKAKLLTNEAQNYKLIGDTIVYKVFHQGEKPDTAISVFNILTGKDFYNQQLVRLPYQVLQTAFISTRQFFFTASYQIKDEPIALPDSLKAGDAAHRYRIFTELPYWSNGRGDTNGKRAILYYYNNGEISQLSDSTVSVGELTLSQDHKWLAYTSSDKSDHHSWSNRLYILNTTDLASHEISIAKRTGHRNLKFTNASHLFLTANTYNEARPQDNSKLYTINVNTGKTEEIYDGDKYEFGNSELTDYKVNNQSEVQTDNSGIIYVTTVADYTPLVRIDTKSSKAQILTPNDFQVDEVIPQGKKGWILIASEGENGQEIYSFSGKGQPKRISDINRDLFNSHSIVTPIVVNYTNGAGQPQRGFALPPVGYQKGKKYPTILDVHGGPKDTYGSGFFHEMQYWANQGYAVIFANPRGGSAQGSDFANLKGDFGGRDFDDLMLFTDAAVKQLDFIDSDNMGVTGGSYGGIMTNWIIGHTNRFKAAASQRSISNWVSFSALSDIGTSFGYNYAGNDAWGDAADLWKHSPLAYADKVTTPTLFIHSEEDYRCPLPEGLQMYSALQYFGIPSRIVIFKGENHELSRNGRPLNRIRRLYEITHWFDKYLKKK